MTLNTRKEPTFGEPNNTDVETPNMAAVETAEGKPSTVIPSLRTSQSPGHTFTPLVKRPQPEQAVENAAESAKVTPAAGFAFTPVAEAAEPAVETVAKETPVEPVVEKNVKAEPELQAERVIPVAGAATAAATVATSSKGRRIGLVALLLAVLGGIFFWLKPSTPETVEELQSQQGGSLPIEFRPVDEEEAKRAEEQARLQAQQQAAQLAQQQAADQQAQAIATVPAEQTQVAVATQDSQNVANEQPIAQPQPVVNAVANNATSSQETATTTAVSTPVAPMVASKPATQGSVVYQPERSQESRPVRKVEKLKPQQTAKVNTQKAQQPQQQKIKAMTAAEFDAKKAKNSQMDQLVNNVEAGKKVARSAPATAENMRVVASKTMTVPKSTSLMQVFRNHNLNISDVNAMSKASNIVSNLKVNEKVTVRLDKNNRVVEMSIGSGGKFTRQADGSYRFK